MIRNPRLAPLVGAAIALITAGTVFLAGAMTFSQGSGGNDVLRAIGPEGADGRSLVLPVNPGSGDTDDDGPTSGADLLAETAGAAPADGLVAAAPLAGDTATETDLAVAGAAVTGGDDTDAPTARSLQPTSGRLSFRGSVEGGGQEADAAEAESGRGSKEQKKNKKDEKDKENKKDHGDKSSDRIKGRSDRAGRTSNSRGKGESRSKRHSAKPAKSPRPSQHSKPKPAKAAKPTKASHPKKPSQVGPPAHAKGNKSNGNGKGKGKGRG